VLALMAAFSSFLQYAAGRQNETLADVLKQKSVPFPPGSVVWLGTTHRIKIVVPIDAKDSMLNLFSPGPPVVTSNGSSSAVVWGSLPQRRDCHPLHRSRTQRASQRA
jgi:hypothetical protein